MDTFSLTECKDGFYLYDYIEGMNIAMYAKTEQEAHKDFNVVTSSANVNKKVRL